MNESGLRTEITDQWGGQVGPSDERYVVVDMLVAMSLIAWDSLAGPPNAQRQVVMADIAQQVGTRSRQPRTVLRKLIEFAQREHGWAPTSDVMRAAGMRAPKPV